jgi:hypothetical protein
MCYNISNSNKEEKQLVKKLGTTYYKKMTVPPRKAVSLSLQSLQEVGKGFPLQSLTD